MKFTIHRHIADGLEYDLEVDGLAVAQHRLLQPGDLAGLDARVRAAYGMLSPDVARSRSKRTLLDAHLRQCAVVKLVVDANRCTGLPADHASDAQLNLNLGLRMKPSMDIRLTTSAVECTASFSGKPHAVTIPWPALYGIIPDNAVSAVFPADMPDLPDGPPDDEEPEEPVPGPSSGPSRVLKLVPDEPDPEPEGAA